MREDLAQLRLSGQMENILLALLKAEKDPNSVIGHVRARHDKLHSVSGLEVKDLARFLKDTYKTSVRGSIHRSLKRLQECSLVWVLRKKSTWRHGYFYGLTDAGRKIAEKLEGRN